MRAPVGTGRDYSLHIRTEACLEHPTPMQQRPHDFTSCRCLPDSRGSILAGRDDPLTIWTVLCRTECAGMVSEGQKQLAFQVPDSSDIIHASRHDAVSLRIKVRISDCARMHNRVRPLASCPPIPEAGSSLSAGQKYQASIRAKAAAFEFTRARPKKWGKGLSVLQVDDLRFVGARAN